MTTYETGRVYSGVTPDDGKLRLLLRGTGHFQWTDEDGDLACEPSNAVTDVRGPLIVLDLGVDEPRLLAKRLRELHYGSLADKIEEQTTPPPQKGWHEVKYSNCPRYYDGKTWWTGPGGSSYHECSFTSTHFIGPASGDRS